MSSEQGSGSQRSMDEQTQVRVTIKSQHKAPVYFLVKTKVSLEKVFIAYCQNVNVEYRVMHFLFNGEKVPPRSTPEELRMTTDGENEIDAMVYVHGGGGSHVKNAS